MRLTHHTSTPSLALPPAFEAFYALHQPAYLAYARLHLPDAAADSVVQKTFGTLVANWTALVSSLNPTADAWDHLSHAVRTRAKPLNITADNALHYDLQVLARLGYTPTVSAEVTGRHPSKIRYLTRTATGTPTG
ncbi:hypothetical protein [Streptomyces peucetius]|nr:hypothetical protein CGZ69_00340 [Streptomyces peucetius subsp. caesius ATCC 27952]